MKFEHLALNVKDPVAGAKWYFENLRFSVIKEMGSSPVHHFIVDKISAIATGDKVVMFRDPGVFQFK